MAIIRCPFCGQVASGDIKVCTSCGKELYIPGDETLKPLNFSPADKPAQVQDAADADAANSPVNPTAIPETPADPGDGDARNWLVMKYVRDPSYKNVEEAAADYSMAFMRSLSSDQGLSQSELPGNLSVKPEDMVGDVAKRYMKTRAGDHMFHKATARKLIISTVILCIICFIALSLMMLYHRNYILYILIIGAAFFVRSRFKMNEGKLLAKKLASMPDTDMESILVSEADNRISKIPVQLIRAALVLLTAFVFAVLFWTPRMIFESNDEGGASLRFYSLAFNGEADVTIPDTWNGLTVTEIRGNVFEGLTGIRTVKLPGKLRRIRAHAFRGCRSLSSVTFPSTIESIGSSAFRDCSSLRTVSLPKGCSVNEKAFKNSPTVINRR